VAKKPTTKAEKEHMGRVANMGCIACSNCMDPPVYDSPALVHHITARRGFGGRSKHMETIPLCHPHHDAGLYGISIHSGVSAWEEKYDTQENLLQIVNERLGIFEENTVEN